MAGKEYTLIIEVNLECEKCYKKIQKILCKLQTKENIRKMDFDPKKNTITISGPFDPERLSKKLRCKACDAIKDIKVVKPQEEKKPEAKKPEPEKKPEEKKPEEKKPPVEKKPEEKKPADDKKPAADQKKPADGGDKKPTKDEGKAAAPPPSTTTTVNLQFTNICGICYPWPCSDPTAHWGVPPPTHHHPPQWPSCEGMAPAPAPLPAPLPHQYPPWGAAPKWAPCGGPSFCGGCSSCHGHGGGGMHGWPVVPPPPPQLQPMCCPGPLACRGCNGCRIVHESKFSYEEYPSSSCAIM